MRSSASDWPGVSVVIPTWNGLPLLAKYLPGVRAALEAYPGPWECLVVDDGGSDATAQALPELFPASRYLRAERNAGFAATANLGFAAARFECVLLLNNDIRVGPDFLRPLAAPFRADAASGREDLLAVVALQINPAHEDASPNPPFDGCRALRFEAGELRLPCTVAAATGEPARPTALANGGCALFAREKVAMLGGFCELFNPFYYEDAELSVRALQRGWRIVFEPRSVVWHRPNTTTSQHSTALGPTAVRNSFFFQWLLFDDPRFWRQHVACLVPRLLLRSCRGDFAFATGFWRALRRWPEVRQTRRKRARGACMGLRSLLAPSEEPDAAVQT